MSLIEPPELTPPPSQVPQRGDRTTFAGRVDAFVTWLAVGVGQLAEMAIGVYTNALAAFRSAESAAEDADAAASSASAAAGSKGAAALSEQAAAVSEANAFSYLRAYRATSYGALAEDPLVDPNGDPPTVGDEYFNTTAKLLRRFNGATWQASDLNTANLAASSGADDVGFQPDEAGAQPTTVGDALRGARKALSNIGGNLNFTTLEDAAPAVDADLMIVRQGDENKKISMGVLRNEFAAGAATQTALATAAKQSAEAARDAAIIGAGVYATEAAGRAAVADGQAFKVQGAGDVAAYEYRRTNSGASVLIATYPSVAAVSRLNLAMINSFGSEAMNGNPVGGAIAGTYNKGTVVLFAPALTKSAIKSISLYASAAGVISVKKFSRAGNDFTLLETIGSVTIPAAGAYTFDRNFYGDWALEAGEYLGFSTSTNALFAHSGTSENQHFYNASEAIGAFTAAAASIYKLQLNAILISIPEQLSKQFTEYAARTDGALLELEIASAKAVGTVETYGKALTGAGASFNGGTTIIPQPVRGARVLANLSLYANVAGTITLKKFTLAGSTFTLGATLGTLAVSTVGLNEFTADDFGRIEFEEGEYIAFSTPTANVITHNGAATDAYYFNASATVTSFAKPAAGTVVPQINFTMVALEALPAPVNRWAGKVLATFGDSITWYDKQAYRNSHVEHGQTAIGYQSHVAEALGCKISNQGRSGYTMPEIWPVASTFNFANVYAVTFTGGANDHRTNVAPGAVAGIGTAFDTNTYAGALQACIEAAYASNPNIKIYLMTPIKGWFFESGSANVPGPYNGEMVISKDYVSIMKQVGELYSIPVLDWYHDSGINAMTYRLPASTTPNYIGDNAGVVTSYALHPTQKGFARMAELLVPFLRDH